MDTCGAKTRAGTPCMQKTIYENGRCKFHGGMATGPVTEAGKEQSRINGRKGGRPRKGGTGKTQVVEPEKSRVSGALLGKVQGRVSRSEIQGPATAPEAPDKAENLPEKPKSWMLTDVNVLPKCGSCVMFASNGACLAVARGVIPGIPTCDPCPAFSGF